MKIDKKLIGIIGSSFIGSEPFAERTWSGISKNFFEMCIKYGILKRAIGVEVTKINRFIIILKNFHFSKKIWRQRFRLDTRYYRLLTSEINKNLKPEELNKCNLLQIGGIYNVPALVKRQCKCFCYNDGNVIQLIKSPFMSKGISDLQIEKAIKYEAEVYSEMDKIFTFSNYLRKSFIEDFRIDPVKVKYIGAGINCDTFEDIKEKNYEDKNILFIGVDFKRKGGMHLLKVFSEINNEHNDAKLHIVGPKKLGVKPEIMKNVVFHGFLSRNNQQQKKKLDDIFLKSSIFVMPSLYEPFGIAPLEAMANKIPCILPNKWAFPEMITAGVHGELFEAGNEQDLVEKINKILGNADLLKEMGQKARQKVLNHYTWDKVVNRLIKALDS